MFCQETFWLMLIVWLQTEGDTSESQLVCSKSQISKFHFCLSNNIMWGAYFCPGAYKHDVVVLIKTGAYTHGLLIFYGCLLSRFYSRF